MGRFLVGMIVISVLFATVANAQSFSGQRSQRTEPFLLEPGVAVFRIDHIGQGSFRVELLDGGGLPVQEVVNAEGSFSGTQAIQVDRGGTYRFQVSASGAWSIQPRAGPDPAAAGRSAGMAAAPADWSWGWFARGLAGGAVAGPLGAGLAFARAGRSEVDVPVPAGGAAANGLYASGFREGFESRLRARRQEAVAVGGLLGTGVFLFVLLQVLDVELGGGSGGGSPPPLPPST